MIRVEPDPAYLRAKEKFRKLPILYRDIVHAGTKAHAEGVKETLEVGLRKGNLVRPKLSSLTLAIRKAKNQSFPTSPIVGAGDAIRNLEVRKVSDGYALEPKETIASGSRISWAKIWSIQENGAIVPVTEKLRTFFGMTFGLWFRASTRFLVVPARHPIRKAVNRYLRSEAKKRTNRDISEKIKLLIEK